MVPIKIQIKFEGKNRVKDSYEKNTIIARRTLKEKSNERG